MLGQITAVTAMNFKNLNSRAGASLVIVVGMACVVGVLLSLMSVTAGYLRAQTHAGDPGRAIILASNADSEGQSAITHDALDPILDSPGIARDASGAALADAEIVGTVRGTRKQGGIIAYFTLRGIGPQGLAVRPEMKLVAGRMFRPGSREMIVGVAARTLLSHFDIGDTIRESDGPWTIVGAFTTGGDVVEGEVLADRDTLMGTLKRKVYNSVIARLRTPASLTTLRNALSGNPALAMTVERHSDYYARLAGQYTVFFDAIAFAVGGIMALGALFGSLNILYSAVAARTIEIATLRALGFGALPVAVSVVTEAVALAVGGALIGAGVAWALFDGRQYAFSDSIFDLSVPSGLIGFGVGCAIVIAFLGAVLPSIRAARLPITDALRAT